MNHSFTDEQLLNLVNNTITTKTEFKPSDFTGGSIQLTSTNNHQLHKFKVSIFFGYVNKNAISRTIDIKEEYLMIWQHALLLKVKSMHVSNNGMDLSELNSLMNTPSSNKVEVVSNKVVSKGSKSVVRTSYELDANIVAVHLFDCIVKENPKAKTNTTLWEKDIEKALRIDGRTKEELINCINWIYTDGLFWIPNIMSGKKLREKYDQLFMQMNKPQNQFKQPQNNKRKNFDNLVDEMFSNASQQDIEDCEVIE